MSKRKPTSQPKLRGLTQMGLIDVPQNPNQRAAIHGPRTVLSRINDEHVEGFIHATKGFRPMTLKRSNVALLTQELRTGTTPWWPELLPLYVKMIHQERPVPLKETRQ